MIRSGPAHYEPDQKVLLGMLRASSVGTHSEEVSQTAQNKAKVRNTTD